jgi:hypothetical protein
MSLQKQGQKIDRKHYNTLAGWVRREGRRETLLRIRMFLGLRDPHQDPLITSTTKIVGKNPSLLLFCDFFMNFLFFGRMMKMYQCSGSGFVPYVFGPPGSVSQRYGSEDPDPHQKCHGSATQEREVVLDRREN